MRALRKQLFCGVVVLASLLLCHPGFAQTARMLPTITRQFQEYTVEDGLAGPGVDAIYQDRQGFIWIGTWYGLSRFDGYEFVNFRFGSDENLDPDVISLAEDQNGALWVGTCWDGLFVMQPEDSEPHTFELEGGDERARLGWCIEAIHEDEEGVLWLGTRSHGLTRLDPETQSVEKYRYLEDDPASLSNNFVQAIHEDESGVLWLGTGNGLNRFDPRTGRSERFLHVPGMFNTPNIWVEDIKAYPPTIVNSIFEDPDSTGVLWLGTGNGLVRFDTETYETRRYVHDPGSDASLSGDVVLDIDEGPHGYLWVGASDGLNRFDRGSGRVTRMGHAGHDLYGRPVTSELLVDHSGVLWIGSRHVEKADVDADFLVQYNIEPPPGMSGFLMEQPIFEDRQGVLWFGGDNMLTRWERGSEMVDLYPHDPSHPGSLVDRMIEEFAQGSDGTMWIATRYGLGQFDLDARRWVTLLTHDPEDPESLPDGLLWDVFVDNNGIVWVASDVGVSGLDPKTMRFRNFPGNASNVIVAAATGGLWIAEYGGLKFLDPTTGATRQFTHDPDDPSTLGHDWVGELFVDPDDPEILWIGHGRGLDRFDSRKERFEHFDPGASFHHTAVPSVFAKVDNSIWMLTFGGIARLDYPDRVIRNYGPEVGLSREWFENSGECVQISTGEAFCGEAPMGVQSFDPTSFEENLNPPIVHLTDVRVFDVSLSRGRLLKPISEIKPPELDHEKNEVTFSYVGLHYAMPEEIRYEYMLEPYDETWRDAGSNRSATYTNLDPDDYVFRVRATTVFGVQSVDEPEFRFTIMPPWWKTWPAYLLFAALAIGAIYGGFEARVRRLRARSRELERAVDERTEDLRLEKEKTEEQARRLAELDEIKNRFFANISHEFRTPLTLILGPVQDALEGKLGRLEPGIEKQQTLIRRNARRLLRLVNQLLDLSRLDSGKMDMHLRPGNLVTFLRELVRVFTPLAERRRVKLTLAPGVPSIPGRFDFDHLEKIFSNLISNALKFTPAGGSVTVVVDILSGLDGSEAKVAVHDTGPGIPKEQLSRIFDRFQQADTSIRRTHEGSGVGLALARELTELHGGVLTVESEVGRGSKFQVMLPVKDVDVEQETATPEILTADLEEPLIVAHGGDDGNEMAAASDKEPLILVVEDNADVREYLQSHLSGTYRLVEAVNGEEGLAAARKHRPDLILSDVMMPIMDGYEMCRLIKANEDLRHIPVIMLTAKAAERDTLEGLGSGADDYIAKPFSVDELLARVSTFITVRRQLRDKYSRAIIVKPGDIEITPDDEVFLDALLDLINAHLGDSNFSVDWLADEMGLSRRQVERKIHAVTGQSPADLLRSLRLERASQLLRARAGTVSEIAYSVGFKSPSHFSSAFSKAYGESPSDHAASVEEASA